MIPQSQLHETLANLLASKVVSITEIRDDGSFRIDPMIVIDLVVNASTITLYIDGIGYYSIYQAEVNYKNRQVISYHDGFKRIFQVLNLEGLVGKIYRHYQNEDERKLWLAAEELSDSTR